MPSSDPKYPAREVGDILREALRGKKATRRHPAETVSDRLGDVVTRHAKEFTPEELDMVGQIRHRLETIAEGDSGVTRPNVIEGERPWCGARKELGGQQPCPLKEACDGRTCRIGSADGSEVYRPDSAPKSTCTCPLGPEDAHFPDCLWFVPADSSGER